MDSDRIRPPPVPEVLQIVLEQEQAWQYIGYVTIAYELQIYFCGIVLGVASLSSALSSSNRGLKAFLAIITIMNVAYTAFRADLLTTLAAKQHRDIFFIFSNTRLSAVLAPFLYIFIVTSAQVFLAIRVIRVLQRGLAKLIWLAVFGPLLLASLTGWAGAMQVGIEMFLGQSADINADHTVLEAYGQSAHLVAAAIIDVLISATLALRLRRDILGFNAHTDSMIRRVVRTTLATGALTSVTASIAAVAAIMYDTKLVSNWATEILVYPLPSLYCLSVFWTLDLRSRMRHELQGRNVEFSLAAPVSDEPHAMTCGRRKSPKVSLPDDVLKAVPFGSDIGQPITAGEWGTR